MSTIDETGFTRTRLDERLAQLEADARSIFGADIDLGVESPDGQFLGVLAEGFADVDELIETVYNGLSPRGAAGAMLSRIVELNGITRREGGYSSATVRCAGTVGTVIPAGSLVAHSANGAIVFQTIAEATIAAVGYVDVSMLATEKGALAAEIGTITKILTVVSGWQTATNSAARAVVGSAVETDFALRARRTASVAFPSQSIADGMAAALADLDTVAHVKVYENESSVAWDPDGGTEMEPHSMLAVVDGGTAAEIADVLWRKRSLGVTMLGSEEEDVTDAAGIDHTMRWDEPSESLIYITAELSQVVSSTVSDAISAALESWGNGVATLAYPIARDANIGEEVVLTQMYGVIYSVLGEQAAGVTVDAIKIGIAPGPTLSVDIVIAYDAIARFSADRVVVTT